MFYPENSRPHPRRIIIHPRNSNIRLTNQETAPSSLQAMPPPPPLPPSPRQVNHWDKFVLLMWKNWLLVRRLKVQTTLEIIIPVIFSALLVLIRGLSDPDVFPEPFDYDSLPLVDSNWNRRVYLQFLTGMKWINFCFLFISELATFHGPSPTLLKIRFWTRSWKTSSWPWTSRESNHMPQLSC